LKPVKPHRNVTFKRLLLDFYQDLRCQKPLVRWLGRPFRVSRRRIEIDITYRCNLRCNNCNRSCTQAPSDLDISIRAIRNFVSDSLERGVRWERIRLLGGEPTLHPRFFEVLGILLDYRQEHNPGVRMVVCTNGSGRTVNAVLARLPRPVAIKNTLKGPRQRLFRPFNRAPVDRRRFALAELSAGCRILEDCGLGLTPLGYYPCAVAGGIDRVLGGNHSRPQLPAADDDMRDQLSLFCRYCGHFGFAWPIRKVRMSPAWEDIYHRWEQRAGQGSHGRP